MTEADARSRTVKRAVLAAVLTGIAACVAGLFVWASRSAPSPIPKPPRVQVERRTPRLEKPAVPADGYVGSATCAECHAEISRAFASHPMGRSLATLADATPVEDYTDQTTVEPAGRRTYRVEKTDDGVRHHEAFTTAEGETLYDQSVEIDYVLGSGRRGRAYLIDRDGLLFLSSLNWYSGRQRWDLAPGYHPEQHPRFERRAIDACVGCHSGRLAFERDTPDRYGDPPFLEESIGCERCHGPGRDHIAFQRNTDRLSSLDPIVNPSDFDVSRREAVCNQCHLQGEQRILRYGRSEHDFRPGNRLEDVWVTFVAGTRVGTDDATRAVSHVEQMRASKCYEATDGRLGCISCHDPHSVPQPEQRSAYFNSKCLDCHDTHGCALPEPERQAAPAEGSCIACHMPPLSASDVPHTSLADHRILRQLESDGATSTASNRLEVFDGADARLPRLEVDRARGLMLVRLAERESSVALAYEAERLLGPVLAAAEDDVEVLDALGTASLLQRRSAEAIQFWNRALKLDPDHESSLIALAKVYHETGRFDEGLETLNRVFAFNRWIGELYGRQAHMLGQLGRFDEGIEAAERALELNPTLSQIYGWLAEIHQLRGNPAESDRNREIHRKIEK